MATYIVFMNDVHDRAGYEEYLAGATAAAEGHDMKVLAFADTSETLEGEPPHERFVMVEFPDRAAAEAWYRSDAYQKVIGTRQAASKGWGILVEGV